MREGVLLAATVLRLDDDNFLACVAATGDDGLVEGLVLQSAFCTDGISYHSADLEDCAVVSIQF